MDEQFRYLEIESRNGIAVMRMKSGTDNTLNIPMMQELSNAHNSMSFDENIQGIILTGNTPGFFCNGLDTGLLLEADTNGKIEIFSALYDMSQAIYAFPKPHISLINGHAMAGGAILASLSDFRFMTDSSWRFGFTEVKIGLAIPSIFIDIIKQLVVPQKLNDVLLLGRALKGPDALEAGLVNDILDETSSLHKTEKFLSEILRYPLESFSSIKYTLRKELLQKFSEDRKASLDHISGFFNDTLNESLLAIKEKRRPHYRTVRHQVS